MKVLTFAAALALASAACPNQCSGHGFCDENDRCTCYKSPGTRGNMRPAYTGADCSQRVCPFGRSHALISDSTQELLPVSMGATPNVGFLPSQLNNANNAAKMNAYLNNGFLLNRNIGLDVKVVSVNTGAQSINFQYKFENQQTFNQEYTANLASSTYVSRATAFQVKDVDGSNTGLFLYFDVSAADFASSTQSIFSNDWYFLNVTSNEGMGWRASDLNTAHGLVECSGRGACDRMTGTCKCAGGYTGDSCQRTECPNDCSGHGTCQSQRYFVEEGTNNMLSYDGFDAEAQMGCKCDAGFRGADCSMIECPSGSDPMHGDGGAQGQDCSARGLCDYTTGICSCFKGYFGERCEELTNLV